VVGVAVLERAVALGELLGDPRFYAEAAAAGSGEVLHSERHRARDASQREKVIEALGLERRCRNSTMLLGRRDRVTGARSLPIALPCGSWYCPDCAARKKADWGRVMAAGPWSSVLFITMPAGLADWCDGRHVKALYAGLARARRLMKRLRWYCAECRNHCHTRPGCSDCGPHGVERGAAGHVCARCWVATVRKRPRCAECATRVTLLYATVPEWNSHVFGRRGRLHANVLCDLKWGEFTRQELSAILESAGLGWACKMVSVADVSHAMKSLTTNGAFAGLDIRGAPRDGGWSPGEASRYALKDLTDVARHGGRLGRYPKFCRRISSNVVKVQRRAPDPAFEYSLLKDAADLAAWFEGEQARALVEVARARLAAAAAPFRAPGCVCHDDLLRDGRCLCGAGVLVELELSRAPPALTRSAT
jgi:hypothetical protein